MIEIVILAVVEKYKRVGHTWLWTTVEQRFWVRKG